MFSDVSFRVRKGEILGFSGLVGSGRTELARAVFGMDPRDRGKVFLDGRPVRTANPHEAIQAGIAYLTEDRKELGLYLNMAIRDNLVAPTLRRFTSRLGFMQNKPITSFASEEGEEFSIATPSALKKVGKLSGGNQQKCLVATWVGTEPKVIFLDEPTRGVDVASREDIYVKIEELARSGVAVVLISSDLPELIRLCDRILVMHHGRIGRRGGARGVLGRADSLLRNGTAVRPPGGARKPWVTRRNARCIRFASASERRIRLPRVHPHPGAGSGRRRHDIGFASLPALGQYRGDPPRPLGGRDHCGRHGHPAGFRRAGSIGRLDARLYRCGVRPGPGGRRTASYRHGAFPAGRGGRRTGERSAHRQDEDEPVHHYARYDDHASRASSWSSRRDGRC